MKKYYKYFWIFLALFALQCCKHKEEKKLPEVVNPREVESMSRTKEDTLKLIDITKQYLEQLKSGNIDAALDMLYIVKGDNIEKISEEQRKKLKHTYIAFPVLAYNIDEMYLYSDSDTEIRYTTTFFKKSQNDNRPNTLKFVLNPHKVMGKWVLTISDKTHENNYQNN